MLIFHKFKSPEQAQAFVKETTSFFGLKAYYCKDHEEVDKYDIFPFELIPPMAVVERTFDETERDVELMAFHFDGEFAGT